TFHQFPAAPFARTGDACGNRPRVPAPRIPGAGEKSAVAAMLERHGFAAFFADLAGKGRLLVLDGMNVPFFIPFIIRGERTFRVSAASKKRTVAAQTND